MQTNCLASKHNLFLDVGHRVTLCCNSHMSLDYQEDQIDSALVGKTASQIQSALDSAQPHSNCDRCWQEQNNQTRSYRHSYNDMYPEFASISQPQLKTVHIQNDSTCNLTCVYCGPRFSSKWADLVGVSTPAVKPLSFSDQALADLHMITLAGGEPGLSKNNLHLLNRLYDLNPNCHIIINTNLYHVDNPVFEKIMQFKNNTVIASFETTGQRYDYIRQGSKWDIFAQNFQNMSKVAGSLQASMILFPLSIFDLPQAINFAIEHIPASEIYINDYYGEIYNWQHVEQGILDRLKHNLSKSIEHMDPSIQSQIIPRLDHMVSTAETTKFPIKVNFDALIQQSHKTIFSELYQKEV